jgi:ubiquinone/menaquinone biosynthesis C-methylase UbiE
MQTHDKDAIGYSFVPALGHHLVMPAYDFLCSLFGLGRGFKSAVVDQAGIVDGSRVLDLACGTGVAAMIVKQRYPRCAVTGLDVDARILEAARRRMTKAEVSGVALVCAPAERTGLDAASFDTVISTLAFHHLPPRSKQKAAGEVARLLRAGGTFLLVDIQPRARSVPTMTEEQAVSPKWASRSNTADNLYRCSRVQGSMRTPRIRHEPGSFGHGSSRCEQRSRPIGRPGLEPITFGSGGTR